MDRLSRFARLLMPGEQAGEITVVKRGMLPTLRVKDNLAAWFRYGRGITAPSGLVSEWKDASGNGRHLLQATEANRPSLQNDNSILFDGVDNYLKCDAFTLEQPETVYFLGKQVTWTVNERIYDGNTNGTMALQQNSTTPQIALVAGLGAAPNNNFAVNTYAVVAAVFNGASSALQVNNTAAATGNASTNNAGGFTLGANGSASTFTNIQVKEVLIYAAAHDATTRASVIKYLAQVGKLVI